MVGNGVTDPEFDDNALVPFVHGMGLISDTMFEVVLSYNICFFIIIANPLSYFSCPISCLSKIFYWFTS